MATDAIETGRVMSASELRRPPFAEREAILSAAAARAEAVYRSNAALVDFEAFGQDDLHGTSTATQEG
jgi:hypothetical protein